LDHLGITNLKREGEEMRGPCPICSKGPRSFAVNTGKNQFHCFACKAKGSVIDLVAKITKCDAREAGLKIWDWFNLDNETSSPTAPDHPEPRGEPEATEAPAGDVQQQILATLQEILAELRGIRRQGLL
jgi:DNA primase